MQKALHPRPAARLASERRIAPRSDVDVPIVYSFLKTFSSRTFDAIASNCSDDGLCIETLYKLSPGQYVCIRKKRALRSAAGGKNGHLVKPFKVAQVRWCAEKTGGLHRRFGVGLQYC